MKPPEYYRGREQTYLKHFFLERYLEKVAYNILSRSDEFVYVDGFSGPWRSEDEEYQDTSFIIAINKLRKIRDGLKSRGREVRIRCLFIEKEPEAFTELESSVAAISDMEIAARHGAFENLIPDIASYIGGSFSFVFIDPTGWTGFALQAIRPILILRGEVIINFMFEHIRRFIDDPRQEIITSYDPLFGGPGWYKDVEILVGGGISREDAIIRVYQERLRQAGGFRHVTSTQIKKPLAERTYFYLVYATRHWKGLVEFREVEKKTIREQSDVRVAARIANRADQTGMDDMFGTSGNEADLFSEGAERSKRLASARTRLHELLATNQRMSYEEILGAMLEERLVWASDIKAWIVDMCKNGTAEIEGLKQRERTPKAGHTIVFKG